MDICCNKRLFSIDVVMDGSLYLRVFRLNVFGGFMAAATKETTLTEGLKVFIEEWKDREDEGILYVPNAGEILYLLKNNPFRT